MEKRGDATRAGGVQRRDLLLLMSYGQLLVTKYVWFDLLFN